MMAVMIKHACIYKVIIRQVFKPNKFKSHFHATKQLEMMFIQYHATIVPARETHTQMQDFFRYIHYLLAEVEQLS